MDADLDTAAQLLAAVEANVSTRRRAEAERLALVLAWCDRHGDDPQTQPEAVPARCGGDRLLDLGGPGTPGVQEFALAELAIALQAGTIATRNLAADALDLRHRLPVLYRYVHALVVEVWVARKIASLSRNLSAEAVVEVDAIVSAQAHQPAPRLLEIAEKAIIQADPDAHRERLAKDATRTGFWLTRKARPGEALDTLEGQPATRRVSARLSLTGALDLDQTVEDLADALAQHTEHTGPEDEDAPTRDQLRAQALELLADPHAAVAFLNGLDSDPDEPTTEPTGDPDPGAPAAPSSARRRPGAVIHLHLGSLSADTVADVEGIGPLLIDQLAALLGHRHITVQPLVDLHHIAEVDGYHHPQTMRQRVFERTGGEVWPHSASRSRRVDYDHVQPYAPPAEGGPPGQTRDTNTAPLTRQHHRYKTHAGYHCTQIAPGVYRWTTPHGLTRIVTTTGTRPVQSTTGPTGLTTDLYPDPGITLDLDEYPCAP